jgi:hypothetical protein
LIRYASPCILLSLSLLFNLSLSLSLSPVFAQHPGHPERSTDPIQVHDVSKALRWEGSAAGIAYSEFNHHLSSIFILVIGFAELLRVLAIRVGVLMPLAMFLSGIYLVLWSDHEAWPIGSLSFLQTFFGGDWEIIQHKVVGILALGVGTIEALRRMGGIRHPRWTFPLPVFAIVGGLSLFLHSHGSHPGAHKIAIHHAVMGILAVAAGSSKLAADWRQSATPTTRKRWDVMWAACILLIGLQLLMYSE